MLIDNMKQNKPFLIVKDLEKFNVPSYVSYYILLTRGVFKWFAVRRDLIRLKNRWRDELAELYQKSRELKKTDPLKHRELVGYIKALEKCRGEVRALCHSPRWRAPDNDKEAIKYLEELTRTLSPDERRTLERRFYELGNRFN